MPERPSPNTASARQVRDARRIERTFLEDEADALRWVLDDPRGRRVLYRIAYDFCQLEESSYLLRPTGQGGDTVFNEGKRYVGQQIVGACRRLESGPRAWLLACAEAIERDEEEALRQRAALKTDSEGEDDAD